jgi:hypothetical protein
MADIVEVPTGNFTPGAAAAVQNPARVINAAWNLGLTKSSDTTTRIDAITDETTGWLSTQAAPHVTGGSVTSPNVVEPNVTIPESQSAGDVMTLFDTKYAEMVTMLSDKFIAFRTTYFPDESATYSAAETWLKAALDNPTSGLPVAVQDQLLTEDKDRITADAVRASDAVLQTFAARRFPLPPGAAASAITQIQQKAQDEIAGSSRKLTIMSVDTMKFAIEKTLVQRQMAMSAAVEYIKAIASPDSMAQLVNVGYDAQSKLISAASQFYNSRTAVAELTAKVAEFNVSTTLDVAVKNQAADLTMIEDRLKAMLAACQLIAQEATSLFNNVHASAGTSYSVNGT